MVHFSKSALIILSIMWSLETASCFISSIKIKQYTASVPTFYRPKSELWMSSTDQRKDFNSVKVEKTGGRGVVSVAQEAADKNLSLGAPGERPQGGEFLTRGGVQVTATVESLTFVNKKINGDSSPVGTSERAIEDLIDQLDNTKGVLLSSSYEFPGRYVLQILMILVYPKHVLVIYLLHECLPIFLNNAHSFYTYSDMHAGH